MGFPLATSHLITLPLSSSISFLLSILTVATAGEEIGERTRMKNPDDMKDVLDSVT